MPSIHVNIVSMSSTCAEDEDAQVYVLELAKSMCRRTSAAWRSQSTKCETSPH